MLYPAFIWYVIYIANKNKNIFDPNQEIIVKPISKLLIALFYALMIFQIFTPVFLVKGFPISEEIDLYGVDIQSQSIISKQQDIGLFLLLSIVVFSLVYMISFIPQIKHILFTLMSFCSVGFFGLYIYYYYRSILLYYIESILLFSASFSFFNLYFLIVNILFLIIQTIFYIGGYFSFIIHMFKE